MLRDNSARARAARLVFLLLLLVTAGVIALTLADMLLPNLRRQSSFAYNVLLVTYSLLLVAQLVVVVASYVFLIRWLRRAYYNLHQLPGLRPEYTDGWAAGAWFVPFINFWRPYTITREVWDDTQLAAFGQVQQPATLLGWWWAAYLIRLVVGQVSGRLTGSNGLTSGDMEILALDAAAIFVFAALTWVVIGRVARFEEQLALRQQVDQLGQPAPAPPAAADQSDYALAEGY